MSDQAIRTRPHRARQSLTLFASLTLPLLAAACREPAADEPWSEAGGSGGFGAESAGSGGSDAAGDGGEGDAGEGQGGAAGSGGADDGSGGSGSDGASGGAAGSGGASGGAGGEGAHGGSSGGGSGGAGGSGNDACVGPALSISKLVTNDVPNDTEVRIERAIALSQKFLVSQSEKTCVWGAMVTDDSDDSGPGLLAVEFSDGAGDAADATSPCRSGARGLPEDLAPGEVLSLAGKVARYAPATCGDVQKELQLVLDPGCAPRRLGKSALPAPFVLGAEQASAIARGDADLLTRYAGARVRLESVSAARDTADGDAVGPYGVVSFEETALTLRNKIYYNDLSLGGPGDASKRPEYAYPTQFSFVEGVVRLDYCTWALHAVDRCEATDPVGGGCL